VSQDEDDLGIRYRIRKRGRISRTKSIIEHELEIEIDWSARDRQSSRRPMLGRHADRMRPVVVAAPRPGVVVALVGRRAVSASASRTSRGFVRRSSMPMPTPDTASTQPRTATPFPFEQLDAWHVAREVVAFVVAHRERLHGLPAEVGPQLERAAVRAALNLAEATGRVGVRDRPRVFAIARGEACEAAAALDIATLYGAVAPAEAARVRLLLCRLAQMLTRLARPR
jgi:four helix bundle protein